MNNKDISIIKIILALLFAVSWLAILFLTIFFLKSTRYSDTTPLFVTHHVEELGLYFYSEKENDSRFKSSDEQTLYFSKDQNNLFLRKTSNYVHYREIPDSLSYNKSFCDAKLRFCQINGVGVCVVSERAIVQSVDFPIVVYNTKGQFTWNGKTYRIEDIPYIAVFLSDDNNLQDRWDSYQYRP